jgi:membrane protein involved in colicin uptake
MIIVTSGKDNMTSVAHEAGNADRLLDMKAGIDDLLLELELAGPQGGGGAYGQGQKQATDPRRAGCSGNVIFVAHSRFTQLFIVHQEIRVKTF